MRFFVAATFLILVLLFPVTINAQEGLYGCKYFSTINICQGYDDCEDGYTTIPSNIQNCNNFNNDIVGCNNRNFICVSENQPDPGESGGACRSAEPQCNPGLACLSSGLCAPLANPPPPSNTAEGVQCPNRPGTVNTAIGCIDFNDVNLTASFFLRWGLGIAGGVALLMIGLASYRITTSQGDPRRLQGGQELLLSAIGGLLMIVLSVYLLRFIGVDLLGIF
jgi:hypothetical protein